MGATTCSEVRSSLQGPTTLGRGLIACTSCRLVCRQPAAGNKNNWACPRCGATLHARIPNSLDRTWALIIAAAIFYIPANVLTITQSAKLGKVQSDTILSGVIYFFKTGSWHIAVIIFVASIIIPLMKLVVLTLLMASIHRRSSWRPGRRTRIFRIVELIGRWSMVDIFVITIAVSLVRLGFLASIQIGPGAVFFGAVVVLTMLAAISFDSRLIWDEREISL